MRDMSFSQEASGGSGAARIEKFGFPPQKQSPMRNSRRSLSLSLSPWGKEPRSAEGFVSMSPPLLRNKHSRRGRKKHSQQVSEAYKKCRSRQSYLISLLLLFVDCLHIFFQLFVPSR